MTSVAKVYAAPARDRPRKARKRFVDLRSLLAGCVVWSLSGTPAASIGSVQLWLLVGLAAQLFICVSGSFKFRRGMTLAVVAVMFAVWTIVATVSGMPGQLTGLSGQIIKIAIIALPAVSLKDFRRGLIDSMAIISVIALVIYFTRQTLLMAGFDIANLFDWFYPLTGLSLDRTILIYNFDIPKEIHRNSGPFREPGMFAANLVIAGLLTLMPGCGLSAKQTRRRLGLFAIALLTSQSTMGLAAVPLLCLLAVPVLVKRASGRFAIAVLLLLVSAVAFTFFGAEHIDKVEHQLNGVVDKQSAWYNTRFGNAYIDAVAIAERPLLGYGFSEEGRPHLFDVYGGGDELGLGNGLTGAAVKFGLVFATLLYLIFLYRLVVGYRGVIRGIIAWSVAAIILFSQQLLLMPALFALLGRYPRFEPRRQLPLPERQNATLSPLAR